MSHKLNSVIKTNSCVIKCISDSLSKLFELNSTEDFKGGGTFLREEHEDQ